MPSDKSSIGVNLDPDLSGAQAAEAGLKNQIAAAQAAGKSYEELEAALAAVQSRFEELAGGAADYTGRLKEAAGAAAEAGGKQKSLREALGGLLPAFVNPFKGGLNAGLHLIESARGGIGKMMASVKEDATIGSFPGIFQRRKRVMKDGAPADAAGRAIQALKEQPSGRNKGGEARISADTMAKGERSLRERRLVETQKSAEKAAVNSIETNPLERARKLGEIEDKYAGQKPQGKIAGGNNEPGEKPDAAPGAGKDRQNENEEGPDKMKESYHVPATSIEKMGFVFGGAMSSDHAATTASNTTKMVAQLGTLIGVASGRKAAGDTTLSNSHAQ